MPPPIRNQNPKSLSTAFSIIFLKNNQTIKTMSRTRPNPTNPIFFSSPQSLSDWLKPRLPFDSFSTWGVKPGTKNVHNLWIELSQGETSLVVDDSTPPLRTLDVVIVKISSSCVGKDGKKKKKKTLVESHQELSDGSLRERFRPLSEKMKPDENLEEAVVRAVKEELGSILNVGCDGFSKIVRIVEGTYEKRVEYPGLRARYVLHSVDAHVEGLPEGEFCTTEDEYGEEGSGSEAVSVKRHFWKWVDCGSD